MSNLKYIIQKFLKNSEARKGKSKKIKQEENHGHWSYDDTGLSHEENMLRANLNKQSC